MNRDDLLRELSKHDRRYLLWELSGREGMGQLTFEDNVDHLDLEDEPIETQVEGYVQALESWFEEMPREEYKRWLEYVEREYGAMADIIVDQFGSDRS